jgi:hypothetical protein
VNAYFMLRNQGRELAEIRSKLRTTYSHFAGGYFAKNPQLGMGHPYFVAAGAIYHLGPILLKASAYAPTTEESEDLSRRLVDQHAIEFRGFAAIVKFLEVGAEAVEYYEDRVRQWPDLFKGALESLLQYQSTVPPMAQGLFVKAPAPEERSDLPKLGGEFCRFLASHDFDGLQDFLGTQRDRLARSQATMTEKRNFKQQLDSIYETRCD